MSNNFRNFDENRQNLKFPEGNYLGVRFGLRHNAIPGQRFRKFQSWLKEGSVNKDKWVRKTVLPVKQAEYNSRRNTKELYNPPTNLHKRKLGKIALLQQKAKAFETEIAQRKKTEVLLIEALAKLKASEQFNTWIIDNSADSIKVLDLNGRILTINNSGANLLAVPTGEELKGKDYRDLWKNEFRAIASRALSEATDGKVARFSGMRPNLAGEEKWWDVAISPIVDEKGKVEKLLTISRDITFLKEMDRRKEDFINATSHELKTPLTSQLAYLQLYKQKFLTSERKAEKKYLTKIENQTKKLIRIVSRLINSSEIQNGNLKLHIRKFNLSAVIEETISELKKIYKRKNIIFKSSFEGFLEGDKDKIRQLLTNLLSNAIKFSSKNTQIIVSLGLSGGDAEVSIQDFGCGIDKKYLKNIFERFPQTEIKNHNYPGLGLGLYISSAIVKSHGGSIRVESKKGSGSTFSFTIPLKR